MSDATLKLIIENLVPIIGAVASGIAVIISALNRTDLKAAKKSLTDVKASVQVVDDKTQAAVDLTKEGNQAIADVHQAVSVGAVVNAAATDQAIDRSEEIAGRVANLEANQNE